MNQKRETFRSVTLWTWILVQGIVTPIFCFYPSAPTEARVRWVAVVAVLLTLIYGLTVGRLDIAGRIGGLLSVQSWLDKERKKRTSREPQLSDEKRLRQGLDQLRVSITTAIGAALGAQMVSLHRDPANLPDPSEETLLVTLATFFIVACLSSVFQINLFALLGQVIWNQNQKDQFRLFVRYLATFVFSVLDRRSNSTPCLTSISMDVRVPSSQFPLRYRLSQATFLDRSAGGISELGLNHGKLTHHLTFA